MVHSWSESGLGGLVWNGTGDSGNGLGEDLCMMYGIVSSTF